MQEISIDESKKIQLSILDEIDRICKKHEIKYFLSDGTLIGAVRHNGFIPWDDDIDIGMLRNEFERFKIVAQKELGERYFLQDLFSDKYWTAPVCRIRDTKTTCKETQFEGIPVVSGLFVDIQPYDNVPKNRFMQKLHKFTSKYWKLVMWVKLCKLPEINYIPQNNKERFRFLYVGLIHKKMNLLKAKTLYYNSISKYKSEYVTKFGGNYKKNIIKKQTLENIIYHTFEDKSYPIPEYYDLVLSQLYGNYMELPPLEKRIGGHGLKQMKYL